MQVPQPAAFLGLTFDVWVFVFMAVLAVYAVIVLARRKRKSFASLGDDEHYEEPTILEGPVDAATTEHDPNLANARALETAANAPPVSRAGPETRH
jgi:hypothetical protein